MLMDNVNKISKIDTSLNDSAYRGSQNDNKVERNKVEKIRCKLYDKFS